MKKLFALFVSEGVRVKAETLMCTYVLVTAKKIARQADT